MSWIKLKMKFPGNCLVCNEKINAGESGLWQKGTGVKHEKCSEPAELKCILCGGPAGCATCEFQDDCDLETVSQLCICKSCMEKKDIFSLYQKSAKKKFPLLNLRP